MFSVVPYLAPVATEACGAELPLDQLLPVESGRIRRPPRASSLCSPLVSPLSHDLSLSKFSPRVRNPSASSAAPLPTLLTDSVKSPRGK